MDSLQQFFNDNLGKPVEKEDGSNLDQCFDWAFAYVDFLNIPRSSIRHLYAYQIWTEATDETKQYFDLIPNTLTDIPQRGDMPVFDKTVGPAGHVCVATGTGDTSSFQSTDQNWNGHLYVEYVTHSYNGVIGWLRPKITTPPTTDPLAECLRQHAELVTSGNAKDATIKNLNDQINVQNELIKQKELQLSTQDTEVTEKDKTIQTLQAQANQLPDLKQQLDQAVNSRNTALRAQEEQNKTIGQLRNTSYMSAKASILFGEFLKAIIEKRW